MIFWHKYSKTGRCPIGGWLALLFMLTISYSSASLAVWSVETNTQAAASNGDYTRFFSALNPGVFARVNDIVVDANGNVYSVGFLDNGTDADAIVAKHDALGALISEAIYDNGGSDKGLAITLDGPGNVYVAAVSDSGIAGNGDDIVIIKYDSNLIEAWNSRYDHLSGNDEPVGISVTNDSSLVVVTGRSHSGGVNKDVAEDITTIAYSAGTGNLAWEYHYDNSDFDAPVGVAIDADNNIYVAGISINQAYKKKDVIVFKHALSDGALLWSVSSTPSPLRFGLDTVDDEATAMSVDDAGNVYVTGTTMGGASPGVRDFFTLKLNAGGLEQWMIPYNSGNGHDKPAAIKTDTSGNVYVTGQAGLGSADSDITTIVYNLNGSFQWSDAYNIGADDQAADIAIDAAGNVIVVGMGGAAGNRNLVVLRYDVTGLLLVPSLTYTKAGDMEASAVSLSTDNEGLALIYVAGENTRDTDADGLIVKFGVARPDLLVSSLSGPGTALVAGKISLSAQAMNVFDAQRGMLAPASPVVLGLYFDPMDGNPLVPLDSVELSPNLASGASASYSNSQVIVPSLVDGNYQLVAVVDPSPGVVMERDETNNVFQGGLISVSNAPDIVPVSVSSSFSAIPAADTFTIDYSLNNQYNVATGSFAVSFVLSPVVSGNDIALQGTDNVPDIAGLSSYIATGVPVTVPSNTPPGDYYLAIVADINNVVVEPDETNNSLTSSNIISVTPIVDLTVDSVYGDSAGVTVGGDINVTAVVSADLAGDAGPFNVDVYLSLDKTVSTADVYLDTLIVAGGLTAGGSATLSKLVTVPTTVAQGLYYLGAIVDASSQVSESSELNNSLADNNLTSVGAAAGDPAALPDLVITDVTGPTTATRGDNIIIPVTVENVLSADINTAFDLGVYFSTDTTISTADQLVGSYNFAVDGGTGLSLTGNATQTVGVNITIPLNLFYTYQYRKLLTVSAADVSGAGVLSDYPVLVDVTDPDLRSVANGGQVESNSGYDIVFFQLDASTQISHELVSYDPALGRVVAWAKMPALSSSSDTSFYIYYGNPSITTSTADTPATWSNGYKGVWHFDRPANSSIPDATGNNEGFLLPLWASNGSVVVDAGVGTFDSAMTSNASVIKDGGIYKMWYSGYDGANWRIGYATSVDGQAWTKGNGGNPILDVGPANSYDDSGVLAPSVILDGGAYKMWYTAFDGAITTIAYATSSDGIIWTKHDLSNPVFSPGGAGAFDSVLVTTPTVVKMGSSNYHMWYGGNDGSKTRVGYATSVDGVSWTRQNGGLPVVDIGPAGTFDDFIIGSPSVLYDGTRFRMWYEAFGQGLRRIIHAVSTDGVNWVKNAENPVLDLSSLSKSVYSPEVIRDTDGYKMWFGFIDSGSPTGMRISYAVSADPLWTPGQVQDALIFDGIDDRVSVGNGSALQITNELTICAWVDPDVDGFDRDIVSKGPNDYILRLRSDNRIGFMLRNAANDGWKTAFSAGPLLASGGRYHVCGTFGNNVMRVYVNGVGNPIGQSKTDQIYSSGSLYRTTIGAMDQNGSSVSQAFDGFVDEVTIANVGRSADWIATQYREQNDSATFVSIGVQEASGTTFPYYLGAVVDYGGVVNELNEGNNSKVHSTVSGAAQQTLISVKAATGSSSSGGGGFFGMFELLAILFSLFVLPRSQVYYKLSPRFVNFH